jgi:hypothetical protein
LRQIHFKVASVKAATSSKFTLRHKSAPACDPSTFHLYLGSSNSQRDIISSLLSTYETSSDLDFDCLISLFLTGSPSEVCDLIHILDCLTRAKPSLGSFLLTEGTADALTRQCHAFFVDCPDIAFHLLSYLSLVLHSQEFHTHLVLSSFYSLPHDLLHKISGDLLFFSPVSNRPEFEAHLIVACLSVISAFFAFPSPLTPSSLSECFDAIDQHLRSTNPSIRAEAHRALANVFHTNCPFALSSFGIGPITDTITDILRRRDSALIPSALGIARSVALFPDKRNAHFLLDRNLLDLVGFDTDKTAALSLVLAFLQHDGALVTLVLASAAPARALRLLTDEPYCVRALAFRLLAAILQFPQCVSFVLENPAALAAAADFVDGAEDEDARTFVEGLQAFAFYAAELGMAERARDALAEAGIAQARGD